MIQLNIREACKKQKDDISIAMQYIHSRQSNPQMFSLDSLNNSCYADGHMKG